MSKRKAEAKKIKAKADKPERKISNGYLHGDTIDLPEDKLNFNEKKVLAVIREWDRAGRAMGADDPAIHLRELAAEAFPRKPERYKVGPGVLVRNALRRLVAGGYVKRGARGTYQLAPKVGGAMATRAKPEPKAKPKRTLPDTRTLPLPGVGTVETIKEG